VNKVLTFSTVELLLYAMCKQQIVLAVLDVFKASIALSDDDFEGCEMLLKIFLSSVGQMSNLQNVNLILFSVKALSHALLNIKKKKLLNIET